MGSDNSSFEVNHSVSRLIERLKTDKPDAANEIWQLYFQRLLPVARAKLATVRDPSIDEEDILVSVFDRFFRAVSEGRFAKLNDRDDLWQILLMLTERDASDQRRRSTTEKRGRDRVVNQSNLANLDLRQLREMADREPNPDQIVAFNEHLSICLHSLNEVSTREVAIMKLEGLSNQEIGNKLEISLSSVERKLRVIREVWHRQFGAEH
jgi:DNA-directed RNA polymerase specialized sigma24 family protein